MDANLAQTISAVASVVGTVLVAWIGLKTAKLSRAVEQVHVATNSMKDALVASTAKASKAEGVLQGKAEARAEAT